MEGTISVKQILTMFIKHIKLILIFALVGGIIAYFYAVNYVTPLYASSGKLYVQNKVTTTETVNTSDITAASKLAASCSHVFTTEKVLAPISEELKQEYGLNLSESTLAGMISVEAIAGSELLKVSVTGSDPIQAYRVCSMMIEVAPDAYKGIINAGTMIIVDTPKINYGKINASETSTAVKGVLAGAVIAIIIAFAIEFMNKQVKPDDDLYEIYGIPVFAEILSFDSSLKNESKYNHYNLDRNKEDETDSKNKKNKKRGKGAK